MSVLRIAAAMTALSPARTVEIHGLAREDAVKFAETWIVPFLRQTAGDVTITWTQT